MAETQVFHGDLNALLYAHLEDFNDDDLGRYQEAIEALRDLPERVILAIAVTIASSQQMFGTPTPDWIN